MAKATMMVFWLTSLLAATSLASPHNILPRADDADAAATDPCAVVLCRIGTVCVSPDGITAICVPKASKCGDVICTNGTTCCNPLLSICTRPGVACILKERDEESSTTAAIAVPTLTPTPTPTPCGSNTCAVGEECCNASCGICTKPGKGCTKQFCLPTTQKCGDAVCPAGTSCCNASCGICVPPGGFCTQQICEPAA